MPVATKYAPPVAFSPPGPPAPPEGTGAGPALLTAAGVGAPASVSGTADYLITTSASTTGSAGAQTALLAAANAAGDWSAIDLVGDFYVTDTLDLSHLTGFTLRCPPGQARIYPANSFPTGQPLVTFGDSATFTPFNVVENIELIGRYGQFYSGTPDGTTEVTLTKTIAGLQFASRYGGLYTVTVRNCTGWGLDLSTPNGLVAGVAVNDCRGVVVSEVNVSRCLTGNIRAGSGRAGTGATFIAGVTFHAGKVGATGARKNGHGFEIQADDVRVIQIQPYAPTGANLRTVGRVKRLMTLNFKPEGNSSPGSFNALWGAIYASGGGEHWILASLATRTGNGTCLRLNDVDDSVIIGALLSGENKDDNGYQTTNTTAVNVTNASNNLFVGVRINRARYNQTGGNLVVVGDNSTHTRDAVSGWTA